MNRFAELAAVVPKAPDYTINWAMIEKTVMRPFADSLKNTNQSPKHHAEGNVWIHTKMVCESLVSSSAFREAQERQRQEMFLAALFHDIGKAKTTRLEDGDWHSPRHAEVGANTVREMLWREYGLCGSPDLQNFRETVCLLVRYHMTPPYILEAKDCDRRIIRSASNGELASDFSIRLLTTLSAADSEGRICEDNNKGIEKHELCAQLAEELGCLDSPHSFSSPFTEYAYLSGRNVTPDTELFNDSACRVVMMCGLPGTGKDTYIREQYPDCVMISLDDIRSEYGIPSVGNQTEVVSIAKRRMKGLLRKKLNFVFDATNITQDIRSKYISLWMSYKAYVSIVFLETGWEENIRRNLARDDSVPLSVIENMISKLIPPERHEAHDVIWKCI